MEDDTDGDGILDGTEDLDRDGRVDSSEADPLKWDTDNDGLCDGLCSGKGEDQDKDGVRDQNADGDWTETDFLANDSDVDGVLDGAEVDGTYCFKGGSCANTGHPLQALNPDTDGDGLRDGQELSGWMVGIWYERTMEKKENYSVTSDPWDDNSDSDALTDFEEFMNGSDPRKLDTDGDQISDTQEIADKSNITGIEGTPPQIQDVQLTVELVWRANTACLLGQCVTLYTPDHLELHVSFTVTENVGIDYVQVRVTKLSGIETQKVIGSGSKNLPVDLAFGFGLFEALLTGADVNITAYDVNGNGAWGEFHQDSVAQMAVKAIAAMFSAIANVIVEALSGILNFLIEMAKAALNPILSPIMEAVKADGTALLKAFLKFVHGVLDRSYWDIVEGFYDIVQALFGGLHEILYMVGIVFQAAILIMLVISGGALLALDPLLNMLIGVVVGALTAAALNVLLEQSGLKQHLEDMSESGMELLLTAFLGHAPQSRASACDWFAVPIASFGAILGYFLIGALQDDVNKVRGEAQEARQRMHIWAEQEATHSGATIREVVNSWAYQRKVNDLNRQEKLGTWSKVDEQAEVTAAADDRRNVMHRVNSLFRVALRLAVMGIMVDLVWNFMVEQKTVEEDLAVSLLGLLLGAGALVIGIYAGRLAHKYRLDLLPNMKKWSLVANAVDAMAFGLGLWTFKSAYDRFADPIVGTKLGWC